VGNNEQRKHPRITMNIHAKGVINAIGRFTQFTAEVVNLSREGAGIKLSEGSTAKVKKMIEEGAEVVGAEIMMTLVSYVEENMAATGSITFLNDKNPHRMDIGVDLNPLDKKSLATLEVLLDMAPDLAGIEASMGFTEANHFASLAEFTNEMVQFAIITEKREMFWIKNERYMFVGMHKTDNGELHLDCIESVDNPGTIFCADCMETIDPESLL